MRILVLSDLHLERAPFPHPPADADVIVLAGDIAGGADGIRWAREWSGGRTVLCVAGNHEFYGHGMPTVIDGMRHAAKNSSVRVLENDSITIDGVRFLGCTLWSDFGVDGVAGQAASMALCQRVVNDYHQIRWDPLQRPLVPADTLALHVASRAWLTEQLAQSHDGPTVVVTHHVPLIRRPPPAGPMRGVAGAFVSDLSELISAERMAVWIYGHTHVPADDEFRGTRIISNPRGYPRERIETFSPDRVITV